MLSARRGEPGSAVHGFAAGTLLGAALFFLLPEAASPSVANVGYPVVAGFLALYLLDRILLGAELGHGEEHAEAGHAHHLGVLAAASFFVHTLADGSALGLTAAHPELTMAVWVGILLHEVPSKYVFARLLVASGTPRSWIAFAVLGLAALLIASAKISASIASRLPPSAVPHAMGASAGMFLFIATSELLPRMHMGRRGRFVAIGAFLFGLGGALAARELGHAHGS